MQDIGTGSRTAMAQIAAEELGIPVERVQVSLGDSARGPFASISAGSSTIPSMGPAVRSAAADAKRQLLEIAAQRFHVEERILDIKDGQIVSADGGSWPLEEITGLLEDGQILGKGARGPNPTGMPLSPRRNFFRIMNELNQFQTAALRAESVARVIVRKDQELFGNVRLGIHDDAGSGRHRRGRRVRHSNR